MELPYIRDFTSPRSRRFLSNERLVPGVGVCPMSFSLVVLSRLPRQCRILTLLPVALQNLTKFLLLKASYALVTGHRESD